MSEPITITASEGKTFALKSEPTKPIGSILTLAKSLTIADFIEVDAPEPAPEPQEVVNE